MINYSKSRGDTTQDLQRESKCYTDEIEAVHGVNVPIEWHIPDDIRQAIAGEIEEGGFVVE